MREKEEVKRWTAKRKSALVVEAIQGNTTVTEASRDYDLMSSGTESWVAEGKAGMKNALRAQTRRCLKDSNVFTTPLRELAAYPPRHKRRDNLLRLSASAPGTESICISGLTCPETTGSIRA